MDSLRTRRKFLGRPTGFLQRPAPAAVACKQKRIALPRVKTTTTSSE
jgi:hypothetical protein